MTLSRICLQLCNLLVILLFLEYFGWLVQASPIHDPKYSPSSLRTHEAEEMEKILKEMINLNNKIFTENAHMRPG
uniref:Uncharacterized protein n=1 Tax=Acrobeloides nanus TaxID=290746 RepID=A0A914D4S4_9BILA